MTQAVRCVWRAVRSSPRKSISIIKSQKWHSNLSLAKCQKIEKSSERLCGILSYRKIFTSKSTHHHHRCRQMVWQCVEWIFPSSPHSARHYWGQWWKAVYTIFCKLSVVMDVAMCLFFLGETEKRGTSWALKVVGESWQALTHRVRKRFASTLTWSSGCARVWSLCKK